MIRRRVGSANPLKASVNCTNGLSLLIRIYAYCIRPMIMSRDKFPSQAGPQTPNPAPSHLGEESPVSQITPGNLPLRPV